MAIAKGAVSLLYELKRDHGLNGKVLQLGKQDIFLNTTQLSQIAKKFGFNSPIAARPKLDDVELFHALGFDHVESMDASDYQGPDHVHDLNNPVPNNIKGQYDAIFDGGTIEHVFNFPQSLSNVFDLLKIGGIVIHVSPSHNHVDHGFYMFSPTLFWDYYTANNFRILKFYLFEYEADHAKKDWLIYDYQPGCVDHLSFGGWGRKLVGIWCVAQKLANSTSGVVPQQGAYVRAWERHAASVAGPSTPGFKDRVKDRAKVMLKSHPRTYQIAYNLYYNFLSYNRPPGPARPPVIARY